MSTKRKEQDGEAVMEEPPRVDDEAVVEPMTTKTPPPDTAAASTTTVDVVAAVAATADSADGAAAEVVAAQNDTKEDDSAKLNAPRRSSRISSRTEEGSTTTTRSGKKQDKNKVKPTSGGKVKGRTSEKGEGEEAEAEVREEKGQDGDETNASGLTTKKLKMGMSIGDTLLDDVDEEVKLKNEVDEDVDIKSLFNDQGGVIFIYPKANTPGCTNQACAFRDHMAEIKEAAFQVFGLSMDSPKALSTWRDKYNLSFPLLSDPKQRLIKALGASKSSTQVQRSHFVFSKGGKLLHVQSPAVAKDSARQALDFIKSLSTEGQES